MQYQLLSYWALQICTEVVQPWVEVISFNLELVCYVHYVHFPRFWLVWVWYFFFKSLMWEKHNLGNTQICLQQAGWRVVKHYAIYSKQLSKLVHCYIRVMWASDIICNTWYFRFPHMLFSLLGLNKDLVYGCCLLLASKPVSWFCF